MIMPHLIWLVKEVIDFKNVVCCQFYVALQRLKYQLLLVLTVTPKYLSLLKMNLSHLSIYCFPSYQTLVNHHFTNGSVILFNVL